MIYGVSIFLRARTGRLYILSNDRKCAQNSLQGCFITNTIQQRNVQLHGASKITETRRSRCIFIFVFPHMRHLVAVAFLADSDPKEINKARKTQEI